MVHRDSTRGEVLAVVRRQGTAGAVHHSGRKRPSRCPDPAACALEERRPRHFSSSCSWDGNTDFLMDGSKAEPTRRRRVGRWEAWLRRTLAFGAFRLLTGGRRSSDRRLFCRQSAALPPPVSLRLSASICVICGFLGWVRWLCVRTLCLCASVVFLMLR